jgi:F-type H+-transporting ATPase subunit epsilon
MKLKILVPFQVFLRPLEVSEVVAETHTGSFGLLPQRRDCAAALVPGILSYRTPADGAVFVAVDAGVLVKCGAEVLVSVRRAIAGDALAELHAAVQREFLDLDAEEREIRTAVARMEGALISRLVRFQHDG